MFRKPLFWIICTLLALGCVIFTWNFFPKAFPVVTVEITMDRQMAMERAEEIAQTFNLGPEDYRIAASYNLNSRVQNYVELEAGGADAFREMLDGDFYSPYTWRVRFFRELEANETTVRFTPQGDPWGFAETLPEDEPGAEISADSARAIAEESASDFWKVNLEEFTLVESSENMRPGGRLDHTFVYERTDQKIGDAEYRLRLGVGGDKFTELTHFVRVPEAFDRRFEELRSQNSTLASAATIAMIILFGLIGCGFGLFYLLKQRYVIWKQPVVVSSIIAFLVMLAMFNSWPLQWMNYDTALSYQNHVIMQVSMAVLAFIGMAIIFSIIFMAAESLTRKAFPNHINFWKLWSPGAASSKQVLGITFAAFLLVGFELSYVTGTYYFTSNFLDWWYPSSALFNPDVIAEYFPGLTALAISLQAAFWEEALFRAIPIAGAVLIGQRYGRTMLWVVAAFALQAVIFGAAHAEYPQLPFYARTLELIFPSIVFGLVFWFLGLYPAILIHFWYNLVWFSLSIFAISAPGIITSQIMVILLGLLPFWIILFQWFRTKSLDEVPENVLNGAWTPEEEKHITEPEPLIDRETTPAFTPAFLKISAAVGLAGFLVWIFVTDFSKDAPPVEITRTAAVQVAESELAQRNIELDESWQAFSRVFGGVGMDHRFIWQEGGQVAFEDLLGSYLSLPSWYVRYVTFEAEVEERAEEYRVFISRRDSVESFRHMLPEHRPGASIEEEEARRIADQTVAEVHNLDPETLRFVSAESSSLPERTDWVMIYADTLAYPLDEGEARIRVRIAGDEVVGTNRFIHVPEEWSRQYRDSRTIPNTIEMAANILTLLIFLAGIIFAIVRWTKGRFSVRAFLTFSGGILLLMIIGTYNMWPITQVGFSTAQPYTTQVMTSIGFSAVGWVIASMAFGLLAGMVHRWNLPVSGELSQSPGKLASAAVFPILAVVGLFALFSGFVPQSAPNMGNIGMAGASIPLIAGTLSPMMGYISTILLLILVFGSVHHLTNGWQKRQLLFGALLFLAGFVFAASSVESVTSFLLTGTAAGLVALIFYIYILRHHTALIILMAAIYYIIINAGSLVSPMFPGEGLSWILSAVLLGAIAWFWHGKLINPK
ncbi:MAG: CPBP family intramembrane metalloprotease [Balneolaceae bacterium]|nr:MAG: CPBP family intramembrane metalloprotease [Balneolaceae bacterium]